MKIMDMNADKLRPFTKINLMLKLKNAQSLSRTDMKNLLGGTDHNSSRMNCDDQCDYDPDAGTRTCNDGKHCIPYNCPGQPEITSYKCV